MQLCGKSIADTARSALRRRAMLILEHKRARASARARARARARFNVHAAHILPSSSFFFSLFLLFSALSKPRNSARARARANGVTVHFDAQRRRLFNPRSIAGD